MDFLRRVKDAVTNFEGYKKFADENVNKAIKYFFKIIIIFALFGTIGATYPIVKTVNQSVDYLKDDIPDFTIKDDKLFVQSEEPIVTVNEDMSLIVTLNPNLSSEDINTFFEENKKYDTIVVLSETQFSAKMASASGIISYDYKTISQTLDIQELSKQNIIDFFDNSGYAKLFTAIFLFLFAYLILSYIIVTIIDMFMLSVLGLITAKLYKVQLNYKQCFSMAIYAFTLPIILNIIYVLINAFTGFTIQYFQVMYYVIAYIYMIAAILIIRSEFNKTGSDVIKIEEEIKKNEQEEELPVEEPKEEKKDKKKEKEEKGNSTPEPDPGNA